MRRTELTVIVVSCGTCAPPVEGSDSLVGMVGGTGIVRLTQADGERHRALLSILNLDAVLFTSAAEGGRVDVDGNLTQVGPIRADTGEDTGEYRRRYGEYRAKSGS